MKREIDKKAQRIAYGVAAPAVRLYSGFNYNGIESEGISNVPDCGPCLFTVKHHRKEDPFLFGLTVWREKPEILPSYLMRDLYLPYLLREPVVWLLRLAGARRIFKTKEIRKVKGKREQRRILETTKSQVIGKNSHLNREFDQGGYLVLFPEGKMSPGRMGELHPRLFRMASEYEGENGTRVSFVPVGLEYKASGKNGMGREKVFVRFGEPRYFNKNKGVEDLISNCRGDMRKLSGLI